MEKASCNNKRVDVIRRIYAKELKGIQAFDKDIFILNAIVAIVEVSLVANLLTRKPLARNADAYG